MYVARSEVDFKTISTIMRIRTGSATRDFNMGEILAGVEAVSRSTFFLQPTGKVPLEVFDLAMDIIEHKNNKHKQVHPLFYLSDTPTTITTDTQYKLTNSVKREFSDTFNVNCMHGQSNRHVFALNTLEDWYCATAVVYTTTMLMGLYKPLKDDAYMVDDTWYIDSVKSHHLG